MVILLGSGSQAPRQRVRAAKQRGRDAAFHGVRTLVAPSWLERTEAAVQIQEFFDPATSTLTYVVFDEGSLDAVIIDPVLDYEPCSAEIATTSVDQVAAFVESKKLRVHYVLETHAHADHISGAQRLKKRLGAEIAIGARIIEVQATFKEIFDLGSEFATDGSQFDRLLSDGEVFRAGTLSVEAMATPGHTPACLTYKIDDAVFTGDALFIEDYGTGRCDFPQGSAHELYASVHGKLYALPDATRVFVGHDYLPGGRPLRFSTTIGESKRSNVQLSAATKREDYVQFRGARDATLKAPRLLIPSVQLNVNAGRLPKPRQNGRRYLSVPLNLFRHGRDDE
jgi:glyoxylase-like metal-dependent hydrolase (beta-lactamase superfamily II)